MDLTLSYASIADPGVVNEQFRDVLKKLLGVTAQVPVRALQLQSNDSSLLLPCRRTRRQHSSAATMRTFSLVRSLLNLRCCSSVASATDILQSLSFSLDEDNLTWLYRTVPPNLKDPDGALQKKSYKILALVCQTCVTLALSFPQPRLFTCAHSHQNFFAKRWGDIVNDVAAMQNSYAPVAGKVRFCQQSSACLAQLVWNAADAHAVPEANHAARARAAESARRDGGAAPIRRRVHRRHERCACFPCFVCSGLSNRAFAGKRANEGRGVRRTDLARSQDAEHTRRAPSISCLAVLTCRSCSQLVGDGGTEAAVGFAELAAPAVH